MSTKSTKGAEDLPLEDELPRPHDGGSAWNKLTLEQLHGADFAIRRLHTSPVFRGRALEILVEQHAEVAAAIKAKAKVKT